MMYYACAAIISTLILELSLRFHLTLQIIANTLHVSPPMVLIRQVAVTQLLIAFFSRQYPSPLLSWVLRQFQHSLPL